MFRSFAFRSSAKLGFLMAGNSHPIATRGVLPVLGGGIARGRKWFSGRLKQNKAPHMIEPSASSTVDFKGAEDSNAGAGHHQRIFSRDADNAPDRKSSSRRSSSSGKEPSISSKRSRGSSLFDNVPAPPSSRRSSSSGKEPSISSIDFGSGNEPSITELLFLASNKGKKAARASITPFHSIGQSVSSDPIIPGDPDPLDRSLHYYALEVDELKQRVVALERAVRRLQPGAQNERRRRGSDASESSQHAPGAGAQNGKRQSDSKSEGDRHRKRQSDSKLSIHSKSEGDRHEKQRSHSKSLPSEGSQHRRRASVSKAEPPVLSNRATGTRNRATGTLSPK